MTLKSSNIALKTLLGAAALAALGACTAVDGADDNPVVRKAQWFSFMEGGDFKNTCTSGAPDRYRLVYNGIYTEQVRTYDLNARTGILSARLILPANVKEWVVEGLGDILKPWRGEATSRALSAAKIESLVTALDADGAFGPPAVGVQLPSMGFFWTIASCHQGTYHFTGLSWPSEAWDKASFGDALAVVDPIATPINPPRKTPLLRDKRRGHFIDPKKQNEFIVEVGEDGLASFEPLF